MACVYTGPKVYLIYIVSELTLEYPPYGVFSLAEAGKQRHYFLKGDYVWMMIF